MLTVVVIDDSPTMRSIIKTFINEMDDFKVVGIAADAYEGREVIKKYEPDLVTIDINMPKMDGVVFLKNLMRLHPMPAIVISGESARGSEVFEDGAIGFVPKPKGEGSDFDRFSNEIKDTILSLSYLIERYAKNNARQKQKSQSGAGIGLNVEVKNHPDVLLPKNPSKRVGYKIVGIGSSTGGVETLAKIIPNLKSPMPPIVITQHIPYGFSSSFAQRLNKMSNLEVLEVLNQEELRESTVYIAPGNKHLIFEKIGLKYYVKPFDGPKISRHKPSVDVMFRGLNNMFGSSVLGIIMTGMGDDGAIGMKELYENGAYTIAQSEKDCVVFGMPKQAIENNAVKKVCEIGQIKESIENYSKGVLT